MLFVDHKSRVVSIYVLEEENISMNTTLEKIFKLLVPLALNGEVLSLMPKPRNLGFGRVGLLVIFSPAVATTTTMVSFYCSYEAALKNLPISKNINTQDF